MPAAASAIPAAMRAVWYERQGPPHEVLVLGELPTPAPGPGEVLVRVHATGVNPSDTKRRSGWRPGLEFPRTVPHSDGAGVIVAVGANVPAARIGERVWTWNAQRGRAFGMAAEYCALPSPQAVPLPAAVPFRAGACLGVPACTAHYCVFADGPVTGQTILVAGGAGAVGHYAVQMARWGGARVIATVSGEAKAAHARAAGAEVVLNYRSEDVAARVAELTAGRGVERIVEVDFGANLALDVAILAQDGVIAAYSSTAEPRPVFPYYPLAYKGASIRLAQANAMPPAPRARALADIGTLLAAGTLSHAVGPVFPLARAADAHAALEAGGVIGTVVVEVLAEDGSPAG